MDYLKQHRHCKTAQDLESDMSIADNPICVILDADFTLLLKVLGGVEGAVQSRHDCQSIVVFSTRLQDISLTTVCACV